MSSRNSIGMRQIDYHSPVPYYYQLAEILREEIEEGRWAVDELIPAEGTLTQIFGISRSVTRKALDLLEGEGRVLRIKGKGTVVIKPKFSYAGVNAAGRWFSPQNAPVRLGKILRAGRVPAGGNLSRLLDLAPRDKVWEIIFTHTVDDKPVSLSQIYLLIKGTLTVSAVPEFESGGPDILQQLATRYGVEVVDSQVEIDVAAATDLESGHLGVDTGTPLVQVSSLDSAANRKVGFIRSVIRTEHFFFAVDMHRKSGAPAPARSRLSELLTRAKD